MQDVVFVINPGSTSTKYGIFSETGAVVEESVDHDVDSLKQFEKATDQFGLRYAAVRKAVEKYFDPEIGKLCGELKRHADIYVFCLLNHKD